MRTNAPGNRLALAPFYNRDQAGITGTVVHPVYRSGKSPNDPGDEVYFLRNPGGARTGYVLGAPLIERDVYWVGHAAGDPEQVLRAIAALARQHGCEQVRFPRLPYRSPLCQRLRRTIPTPSAQPERRAASWWIRLMDLRTTLQKIAPELARRLRKSHLAGWRGRLLIATPEEAANLSIQEGRVTVAEPAPTEHAVEGGQDARTRWRRSRKRACVCAVMPWSW